MSDVAHEGWSNRETWAINLWLANDASLHAAACGVVRGAMVGSGAWGGHPLARATLAGEALRPWVEWVECQCEDGRFPEPIPALVQCALARVDWRELAEHWLRTAAEVAQ